MSSIEQRDNQKNPSAAPTPLEILSQFTRKRAMRPPMEQCELCSVEIGPRHRHLLELSSRGLLCVCHPCSILFGDPVAGGGKYRLVPERYLLLSDFHMTDEQWDDLMIPVNMVYIFHNTGGGERTPSEAGVAMRGEEANHTMAFYPSPAGAMESTLPLEGWDTLVTNNPILNDLQPDVEALLINRVQIRDSESYREHYIVPIDTCYELVGLIRLKWKGLSGGEEVWKAIADFFTGLRKKATPVGATFMTPSWRGDAHARPEL